MHGRYSVIDFFALDFFYLVYFGLPQTATLVIGHIGFASLPDFTLRDLKQLRSLQPDRSFCADRPMSHPCHISASSPVLTASVPATLLTTGQLCLPVNQQITYLIFLVRVRTQGLKRNSFTCLHSFSFHPSVSF